MPTWKRPEAPSAAPELDGEGPPPVGPSPPGDRPFWSVMLPTYEPSTLLEEALRSVLDQDQGPEAMQIAVVDDRSPGVDVEALLRRIDPIGRVELHRGEANLGLAGNWNRCLAMARGRWVHLLHQDDWVLPGFYDRLGGAEAGRADVGAAYCRHAFAYPDGHWETLSALERADAGVPEDFLALLSMVQVIQCASIVVRRATYEAVGGYRNDLKYTLDWEMHCRIASRYPVWYEPRLLACYRRHEGSETAALKRAGALLPDIHRAIAIIRRHVPEPLRSGVGCRQLSWLRDELIGEADRALKDSDERLGLRHLRQAAVCLPKARWDHAMRCRYRWALKLAVGRLVGRPRRPDAGRTVSEGAPR